MADKQFETRRRNALQELYGSSVDRSRKGSVDAPIQDLVNGINQHPHMFTTSCCSGRISCFAEPTPETRAAGKKGGKWVYASHDKADPEEIVNVISDAASEGGCLVFRMEPFVMHTECRGVDWSAQLLALARQAGYRESGMVPSSKGRCMVGIRCNLRLEVPVADSGKLLVSQDYLRYLTSSANKKFELNEQRHQKFRDLVGQLPLELPANTKPQRRESKALSRQKGRAAGLSVHHGGIPSAVLANHISQRVAALTAQQTAVLKRITALEAAATLPCGLPSANPVVRALGVNTRGECLALEVAGGPTVGTAREADTSRTPRQEATLDYSVKGSGWMIILPRAQVKQVKDSVKAAGWLDNSRKSSQVDNVCIQLPVSAVCAEAIQNSSEAVPALLMSAIQHGSMILEWGELQLNTRLPVPPCERLRQAIGTLIQSIGTIGRNEQNSLLGDLPLRWEKLGDLVLLPASAFTGCQWAAMPEAKLWSAVATALGAKRLGRQAAVASTSTRDSQVEMLLGDTGWVEHREGGVIFCLDVTKCMFSSGNVTERIRMGHVLAVGETVVDLFTGIGYYTLPLLTIAGATKVFACEWNPHAIHALRHNLKANKVAARCTVLQGDCRTVAPVSVADRVLLGLLPSSTCGWETAVRALKDSGGWLHIHENVKDSDESEWTQRTVWEISAMAHAMGREWDVSVQHLERVKWYAPHIRHVVLDLLCQPAV